MSKITIDRAVVEQATKAMLNFPGDISDEMFESIRALKAVLAQQAEPDHETRAELAEQQVVQLAEERDHYRNLWQKAQQAEPVEPAFHGFMSDDGTQVDVCFSPSAPRRDGTYATAYYTSPPRRKPLTEEEILKATGHCGVSKYTAVNITRAIERAIWEKNK